MLRRSSNTYYNGVPFRSSRSCTNDFPRSDKRSNVFNPVDFGADPTGRTDSTEAFRRLQASLFNISAYAERKMASNIVDLGGATLDLAGGEYLISEPVSIPPLVGNVRIRGGTLIASPNFPASSFLVQVGDSACVPADKQNVCNEFISIEDVMLDGSHVARGGVVVNQTMGTTIGPSAFVTGFTNVGVQVNGGHETLVFDSWLAEYFWSDKRPQPSTCVNGKNGSIAIELNGEDNYVTNTIIFDFTCLGVLVNGAATTLDGVHSWNGGGVAIRIDGSYDIQDRIVNCYLDYSTLEIVNPKFVLVEGSFFYNTHAVLVGKNVQGLTMRDNIYSMNDYGGNTSVVLEGGSAGVLCTNVVIEDAIDAQQNQQPVRLLRTVARQSLYQKQSTIWRFDFSGDLLFDHIDLVEYALVLDEDGDGDVANPLVMHAARKPVGTVVEIETSSPVSGSVHASVRQCQ
eukprot:g3382.t1